MSKFKVAVVGAGILGSRHARVFNEHPDCDTVAVIDLDAKRATDVAARVGAKSFTNLDQALDDQDFDVLAVATPDHLHRQAVVNAIERGKHVFLEKPLATTIEDAEAINAATLAGRSTVMINFSQRYVPDYVAIKRLLANGDIGSPAMVTSHKFDTIHVPTQMIGWAAKTSPFMFMSSHDLDLMHWYVGADPVEVVARDRRGILDAAGVRVHDGLNVLLAFDNNIMGNFHASWVHPNSYPVVADGFMQIIGTEGVVNLNNRTRRLEVFGRGGTFVQEFTGIHTANEVNGKLEGGFVDSMRAFIDCIQDNREPETSPRHALPIARAQFAAMQSLKTGEGVNL